MLACIVPGLTVIACYRKKRKKKKESTDLRSFDKLQTFANHKYTCAMYDIQMNNITIHICLVVTNRSKEKSIKWLPNPVSDQISPKGTRENHGYSLFLDGTFINIIIHYEVFVGLL